MSVPVRTLEEIAARAFPEADHRADRCLAALREAVAQERAACASIAGGSTGPGNTLDQCHGYSDACRDIRAAILAREKSE